jgi:hypothetical protein
MNDRAGEGRTVPFDRLFSRVREVLMREWDPIGVRDEPRAQDEYDTYAMHISSRLSDGSSTAESIEAYLDYVTSERMRLSPNGEAVDRTTGALLSLTGDDGVS